jgi:hypothetical protein
MRPYHLTAALLLAAPVVFAQSAQASELPPHTTLPIVFTQTVSAAHAHAGDHVSARTTQVVRLADGRVIPSGATVTGHVLAASGFAYDNTPYAQQKTSTLAISFDTITFGSATLPLHVSVRAAASPIAVNDAHSPKSTDLDSLSTTTQIGGAQLVPSQSEVRDVEGDVVAYNRRDGVYAHLIARGGCDGGNTEVSVDIFSPTACGLYGFGNVSTANIAEPSQLTLVSTHGSPEVWKHTAALLEVLPEATR